MPSLLVYTSFCSLYFSRFASVMCYNLQLLLLLKSMYCVLFINNEVVEKGDVKVVFVYTFKIPYHTHCEYFNPLLILCINY